MSILNRLNWPIITILFGSIWIWYAIFTMGFFHVMFWVTTGAVIGGLFAKIKENK